MIYLAIVITILVIFEILRKSWMRIATKGLSYEIYLDKKSAFVGHEINVVTKFYNKKIIPVPWIKIEIPVSVSFEFNECKVESVNNMVNLFKIVTSLGSFKRIKRYNSFKCSKRGVYKMRIGKLIIGDFLGLDKITLGIKMDEELIVYPKIKNMFELIDTYKTFQGDISVRRWIVDDPLQIIGVRKYTVSDSFNIIDWKATAKNNELYVRKFDFTSEPSIMMILDVQTRSIRWMGSNYDLIEKGIDIVASIMDKALKQRIPIGYTANAAFQNEQEDIFVYPNNNSSQRNRILEALAKTTYTKTYNLKALLDERINALNKNCTIVLLVSYTSSELIKSLNSYVKRGYNLKIILLDNRCNVTGISKRIEIIHSLEESAVIQNVK